MKTKPRKVDFRDADCLEAAVLGLMGCSTKLIMKRTGFTQCQTTYRLGKGGIKRADYRDGESRSFKTVYNSSRASIVNEVSRTIGKAK